jgi:hypothetical protein
MAKFLIFVKLIYSDLAKRTKFFVLAAFGLFRQFLEPSFLLPFERLESLNGRQAVKVDPGALAPTLAPAPGFKFCEAVISHRAA